MCWQAVRQLHLLNNLCHSFTFIGQRGGAAAQPNAIMARNAPIAGTETETRTETESEATLNQWRTIKLSPKKYLLTCENQKLITA